MYNFSFSAGNYRRSIDEYEREWQAVDECLYRLCIDHPCHSSLRSINAKVFVIGRTYQTQIERQVSSNGRHNASNSMARVVDLFFRHREELDGLFLQLRGVSGPLADSNVATILEIHGAIVELMREITVKTGKDKPKSPRSFVSKYMHFHNRIVPLYDGNAERVLTALIPNASLKNDRIAVPSNADVDYATYVRQFLSLSDAVARQEVPATTRSLDYYLLWEYANRLGGGETAHQQDYGATGGAAYQSRAAL